jgi:pyruvate/2-oxoglutarate/acetoin dehydrogenase E1 component/TPP-dependent pyruvate/acetoin dehydrogenase alpha subunit
MAKAAPKDKLPRVAQPSLRKANPLGDSRPGLDPEAVLADYRLAFMSRQASLIGRKEVLTGKAKFGIFGDGKEVAQLAMARAFQKGDWRSGYYRDQTFMFAVGACNVKQFFAQLYADTDPANEPMTAGRQMNAHFSTRYLDDHGRWLNQLMMPNSSCDLSPTAAQMGRLVGLGYASKLYRANPQLAETSQFSLAGNEVAFGTIGNASTAEGIFWEALNACGVLQVPVAISVWDDGFGISVPNKYQMTKESISEICRGFQRDGKLPGFDIHVVKGNDYAALVEAYRTGIERVRREHVPALFHIVDLTQPQGHSTSGSHERYKTPERMAFEEREDCLQKMREWMIDTGAADAATLDKLEAESLTAVERAREEAWQEYLAPIEGDRTRLVAIYQDIKDSGQASEAASALLDDAQKALKRAPSLMRRVVMGSARRSLHRLRDLPETLREPLAAFVRSYQAENHDRYTRYLTAESERSPLKVPVVPAVYPEKPDLIPGNEVIQRCFDALMGRDPRVFIIGEDVGVLGDVNQNFKGLQEKYGEVRITDTGIREATILGQGIGAAMRGLRPVVDIQYLDYLLYCFQLLSDDLATLHYRSAGGQIAPVCVRTKGHRLEGIWHTGSPMGTIIHGIRGIHVCVPRNMVQAAGMYNTIFQGDDPALVIEVLNGYRIREAAPSNVDTFTVPLGVPEVLIPGTDLTLVTYGACVRIAEDAVKFLAEDGISVELVDVQTLLPFDVTQVIGASLAKTNAALFLDEDVPGGASAFMMQQVLEGQNGYDHLDAAPRTLTAQPNRSAYASDADYWCKPNAEDVIETVYAMMHERDPGRWRR